MYIGINVRFVQLVLELFAIHRSKFKFNAICFASLSYTMMMAKATSARVLDGGGGTVCVHHRPYFASRCWF